MLTDGDADIGICTETLKDAPSLTTFPFYSWHHGVVVPRGHDLEKVRPLTLEAMAEWPIITYHEGFTGRRNVDQTFAKAGLEPDIVMSAMDTDVLKAYVELGLGVGIIAAMASRPEARCEPEAPRRRPPVRGQHFADRGAAGGSYLRNYAYRFIEPVLAGAARGDGADGRAGRAAGNSRHRPRAARDPSFASQRKYPEPRRGQAHGLTRLQRQLVEPAGASAPPRNAAARRDRWRRSGRSAPRALSRR